MLLEIFFGGIAGLSVSTLMHSIAKVKKHQQQTLDAQAESRRWAEQCKIYSQSEHEEHLARIYAEDARDAAMRLSEKHFKELKKYKKTMAEIAKGHHLFIRHKQYGLPESRVLTAQELAKETLERGGKVS